MRRLVIPTTLAAGLVLVATPASAFAHNAVHDARLHAILDGLTLLAVLAPLWTVYLWGPARKSLLVALIAVVQLPVAVVGFVPIANPWLHVTAVAGALALTVFSLWYVRRAVRVGPAAVNAPS